MAVRFTGTESGPNVLENMLSNNALESLATIFGSIICGESIWEQRESSNSSVDAWWSYFKRPTLKSLRRKIILLSFEVLFSKGLK